MMEYVGFTIGVAFYLAWCVVGRWFVEALRAPVTVYIPDAPTVDFGAPVLPSQVTL